MFKEANITAIKDGSKIKFIAPGSEFNDYMPITIAESDAEDQYSKINYDTEALRNSSYRKISLEIKMICRRLKNKFYK